VSVNAELYHAALRAKAAPPESWPTPELASWARTVLASAVATGDAAGLPVRWTGWRDKESPSGKLCEGSWRDLCDWLRSQPAVRVPVKDDAPLWAPVAFKDGRRNNDSAQAIYALALDCDDRGDWHELLSALEALGLAYVAHRSPSHSDAGPCKWRLVLPLVAPLELLADDAQKRWRNTYNAARIVMGAVGRCWFDHSCTDPGRGWFPPVTVGDTPPRELRQAPGCPLDLAALLRQCPSLPPPPVRAWSAPRVPRGSGGVAGDKVERARRWIAKRDPAVQGQGGDRWTWQTCAKLAVDFDLNDAEALEVLGPWNDSCQPPWDERDLLVKLANARKNPQGTPGSALATEPPPPPQVVAPRRPAPQRKEAPADEVADLWARCVPVTQDAEVASWLERWQIAPRKVADLDLARALPVDLSNLPSWAQPWTQTGHRLVVRAYAAAAGGLRLAGLHACDGDQKGSEGAAAVVFAVPDAALEVGLELVEGVPDWLRFSTAERGAPVWGVVAGSACPELAALVKAPVVSIRTHDDPAGNKYRDAWTELLRARGVAVRWGKPTTVLGDRLRELRQAPDAEVLAVLWDAMVRRYGGEALVPAPLRTAYVQRQGDLDA